MRTGCPTPPHGADALKHVIVLARAQQPIARIDEQTGVDYVFVRRGKLMSVKYWSKRPSDASVVRSGMRFDQRRAGRQCRDRDVAGTAMYEPRVDPRSHACTRSVYPDGEPVASKYTVPSLLQSGRLRSDRAWQPGSRCPLLQTPGTTHREAFEVSVGRPRSTVSVDRPGQHSCHPRRHRDHVRRDLVQSTTAARLQRWPTPLGGTWLSKSTALLALWITLLVIR